MRDAMVTPPAELPLTWDELRHHLRLSYIDDEQEEPEREYVEGLCQAATEVASSKLRRAIVEATYEVVALACDFTEPGLELPWPILISVEAVLLNGAPLSRTTDYNVVPVRSDGAYFV